MKMVFQYLLIVAACIAVLASGFLFVGWPRKTERVEYGVSFSRPYAEHDLGLNPDKVLAAILDDLKLRRVRLGAYWKFIQPEENVWNFDELDRDIKAVGERGGTVVLAIGEKLPRWPECWGPDWWKRLSREDQRKHTLRYLETVVRRYRDNPTIASWQIENEAHFVYGDCPKPETSFLKREVELVRGLDPSRPVVTTDSGELSLWRIGRLVDMLGVSTYRSVQHPTLGTFRYSFLPPYFYARKGVLARAFGVKRMYVSEFQMEPWSNVALEHTPLQDQLNIFSIDHMRSNFRYAERMGLSPIDFWGAEWWYWMKEKKDHPEFWEEAQTFFAKKD